MQLFNTWGACGLALHACVGVVSVCVCVYRCMYCMCVYMRTCVCRVWPRATMAPSCFWFQFTLTFFFHSSHLICSLSLSLFLSPCYGSHCHGNKRQCRPGNFWICAVFSNPALQAPIRLLSLSLHVPGGVLVCFIMGLHCNLPIQIFKANLLVYWLLHIK